MSEKLWSADAAESRGAVWACASRLSAGVLDTLAELNEQCLELLCEQAAVPAARPRASLLAELDPLWGALDAASRRRAARCPFLLLDAGFVRAGGVRDEPRAAAPRAFFTVSRTVAVARLVLAYAWHLARSDAVAARLLLGMSGRCAERVAGWTLRQAIQLAESEPRLLEPRWPDRHEIWRELLVAASGAESTALERFHIHGVQLLAAESRRRAHDSVDM